MSGLAILSLAIAYGACWAVCSRLVAGHLAYEFAASAERKYPSLHRGNTGHPHPGQWFAATCLGAMVGFFWPIVALWLIAPHWSDRWVIGAEADALTRQREMRIHELERELNLR